MTLNELFAIQEADVTKEFLLKAGWSEIAEEPAEIFRTKRLRNMLLTLKICAAASRCWTMPSPPSMT